MTRPNDLKLGPVVVNKPPGQRLYNIIGGGLPGGRAVRFYSCSSVTEARAVQRFIDSLRNYPDQAEGFIRWLRAAIKAPPMTLEDLAGSFSDNGAEAPERSDSRSLADARFSRQALEEEASHD